MSTSNKTNTSKTATAVAASKAEIAPNSEAAKKSAPAKQPVKAPEKAVDEVQEQSRPFFSRRVWPD